MTKICIPAWDQIKTYWRFLGQLVLGLGGRYFDLFGFFVCVAFWLVGVLCSFAFPKQQRWHPPSTPGARPQAICFMSHCWQCHVEGPCTPSMWGLHTGQPKEGFGQKAPCHKGMWWLEAQQEQRHQQARNAKSWQIWPEFSHEAAAKSSVGSAACFAQGQALPRSQPYSLFCRLWGRKPALTTHSSPWMKPVPAHLEAQVNLQERLTSISKKDRFVIYFLINSISLVVVQFIS